MKKNKITTKITSLQLFISIVFIAVILCSYLISTKPDLESLFLPPSKNHLLGTNLIGQDIFALLFESIRYSIFLSITTVLLSALTGIGISLWIIHNKILSFTCTLITNIFITLPPLIICLLLISRWNANTQILMVGQAIAFLPVFIKLSHKELQYILKSDFVQTAIHLGNNPIHIIYKHGTIILLPKIKAQMLALISVSIGIESSLSYLGIGPPLPHASLGSIIYDSNKYWSLAPWYPLSIFISFFALIYAISVLNKKI